MNKYEFSLVLEGPAELTEEVADKLFECGCDDATPGNCYGVFTVDSHREAESLEAAINSASRTCVMLAKRSNIADRSQCDATVRVNTPPTDQYHLPANDEEV